jgi:antitoxin component YwqK of YwqJK toxin-antitoxin module
MTEEEPRLLVSLDDIDFTDNLFVVYEGEFFTGEAVGYHPNGQLRDLQTYGNGRLRGPERAYYPDGSPRSEYMNVDGVRHGVGRTWFPNGQLESETLYDHAEVLRSRRWAEDGSELS